MPVKFIRRFTRSILLIPTILIAFLFVVACLASELNPERWWFIGALSLLLPYLIIILVFYKLGIGNILSGKFGAKENSFKNSNPNLTIASSTDVKNANSRNPDCNPSTKRASSIIPLLDEMKAYFLQGEKGIKNKEEILSDIRKIVRKCPKIQDSELNNAFEDFLILECENSCSVALSEDDVNSLWEG